MASGRVVGIIEKISFPGTLAAVPDVRAGGSTPAENFQVYDFDASTIWYLDYHINLEAYDGGGLTVVIKWMASSAVADDTRWGGAFRRIADDAEDVDGSHSYVYNDVDATAPSASGEFSYDSIVFTDGADMDSIADGEAGVLRIRRDTGNDDMTGDAELVSVTILET